MITLEAGEKEAISKGHMPTLKKVIERSFANVQGRLVDEQMNLPLIQGHAQVMREILKLIN